MKENQETGNIVIFEDKAGHVAIDVRLEHDTVWLTQNQIADLFGTKRPAITKHLNNIFNSSELDRHSVCSILEHTAKDGKSYQTQYYNLDAIISVGYRVNSKNATKFRTWANAVLKDYLIKGYVIREQLHNEQLQQLVQTVKLLGQINENYTLNLNEATGLLKVIADYAYGLDVLDKYDLHSLAIEKTTTAEQFKINYVEAKAAIEQLRVKFGAGELFGREKDQSFKSSISTIYQTFNGVDLYPSVEEKAAHLLYFVVKNHSFSDGNKRIAAFLFLWFLEKNNLLYDTAGKKRIGDNALVALTLMIAMSPAEEMEAMIKVVVNLINQNN